MIAGRDAPSYGEAKNSWLTGAAAWNFVAVTQWILGIRPEYDGLRIDPCLPGDWDGFEAQRRFRGATYRITVRRRKTEGQAAGQGALMQVDGRPIEGTLIPLAAAGSEVVVLTEID